MSQRVYRVALVGMGNMGKNHAKTVQNHSGFKLTHVVDPLLSRGNSPALPLLPSSTMILSDISELVPRSSEYDVVIIATPTETHYECGLQVLKSGKHLLLEKPAASTLSQAKELVSLAQKQQPKCYLVAGHVERCNPAVTATKIVLDSGILGRPLAIHSIRAGAAIRTLNHGFQA